MTMPKMKTTRKAEVTSPSTIEQQQFIAERIQFGSRRRQQQISGIPTKGEGCRRPRGRDNDDNDVFDDAVEEEAKGRERRGKGLTHQRRCTLER